MGVWKGEPSGREESTWAIARARGLGAAQSVTTGVGRWWSATGLPPLLCVAEPSSTCVAGAVAAAVVVGGCVFGGAGVVVVQWQECWGEDARRQAATRNWASGRWYMGAVAGVGKWHRSQEWRRIIVEEQKLRGLSGKQEGRDCARPARIEKTAEGIRASTAGKPKGARRFHPPVERCPGCDKLPTPVCTAAPLLTVNVVPQRVHKDALGAARPLATKAPAQAVRPAGPASSLDRHAAR
jgi:hypothetical protein